ncbi:MAG: DUF4175 domain-containing protein [Candidatus Rokubacteria bacterium]|nr:DUF4175 domain-containing protein [Candidatus Rokubacteria bacterium]
MADSAILERLVTHVARQVRRRRAEFYGLRGLFVGAVAAAIPLLFREALGNLSVVIAGALLVAGAGTGALVGALLRVPRHEAARLADRGYALQDRVATAIEWGGRPDHSPLVETLVADAAAQVERLPRRAVIPRRVPREARWVPLPLALGLVLALTPPIPLPMAGLPNFSASTGDDEEKKEERAGKIESDERPKDAKRDMAARGEVQERSMLPRPGGGASSQPGDLSAIFKDTSIAGRSPDFSSFLKKGDERIKMLEQVDRLPDLQRDYTQTQQRMIFQKAKSLRGGIDPKQFSPEKLRELLNEMERLGRKGGQGGWSGDAMEGMEALEQGQTDKAMEAMERALAKMRALEERGQDGKGLRGGREGDRRGPGGRERGPGQGGAPGEDGDFPEGEGSLPGRGKSGSPKGDPSQRLRANPFDVGVEGEVRPGRKDSMDTNLVGRGGNTPSRLQYLGVIGQYRRMMEESIAREQVPRDYQTQVKEYFQSLEDRDR